MIEDISDSGCSITIGGRGTQGLRIKIQFAFDQGPLSMCGTVRSGDYKEDSGRSLMHVQADTLSVETRNQILGEVFGVADPEEVLPFRIMDEEAVLESGDDEDILNVSGGDD
jgi:hypothetical protein